MRQTPYLNGIKAFEAAARHGSFVKAAEELHVTPAAVSRMVRLLEDRLGVRLFERGANRLRPTPAGSAYHIGLTPIFDALALLTEQIKGMAAQHVLTVGVGPTFAIRWLIPRLAKFHAAAPGIDARITTGGAAAPFAPSWTCGIKLGDGHWPGLSAEPLFDADLVPVCAPRIAGDLDTPADLARATLLRVAHAPDDWPDWFTATGLSGIAVTGPQFEFYGQALQAACDGLGVALGIRPYIDDDVRAGRLVTPFSQSVPKGKRWWLVYEPARRTDPWFAAFRDWIIAEAARRD